jgi:hypothetical protein
MAGDISRQNGKKGGRKKASHTIEAEAGRAFVVATIARNLKPLIEAMVEEAKKGNVQAFRELFDRAWGKPPQTIMGEGGGPLVVKIVSYGGSTDSA